MHFPVKASKLTANSDAVTEAKTAVSTLAGSRRVRRSDVTGTALSSCTEVSTVSTQMISLVLSYPSSPEILILSATAGFLVGGICLILFRLR